MRSHFSLLLQLCIAEWSSKNDDCGGIEIRPPSSACRIVVQLYWDVAPLACENFATLCANANIMTKIPLGQSGKPLTYRSSRIHRVIPQFILQGGDFVFGNGSGGESIFNGKKFKDERAGLLLSHDSRGVLSMGNSGKNSNTSQFFITFQAAPQCNGKHVVFGKVVSGFPVLDYVETFGTESGEPSVPIEITECGIYTPLTTPGAGYWFDKPDEEAYSGISPIFMVQPRVAVVAPTMVVTERFQKASSSHFALTAICVQDYETQELVTKRIYDDLDNFAIDVVLFAPACSDIRKKMTTLPPSWNREEIPIDQVLLESKPVDALTTVWTRSWLTLQRHYALDGAPQFILNQHQ